MKDIVLGVTGSIAAYKAADIVNRLKDKDYNVHVVMTKAGASFITPLTMQALSKNVVYTDVLQESTPSEIVHIDLPKKATCILIAPATANIIGKIAAGIADDMLSTMVLPAKGIPKILAPAMNNDMYNNVVVQENLEKLKNRGWIIIEPRESRLACGDFAKGALAKVEDIVEKVIEEVGKNYDISN